MTTFADLMALARRTLHRGEAELSGRISVLALESIEDDEEEDIPTAQEDADHGALNDQSLLEALEDGDADGAEVGMGRAGETPIATVLWLSAIAKQFRDVGMVGPASSLNEAIEAISADYEPDFSISEPETQNDNNSPELRLGQKIVRRWALLCAQLIKDRKIDIAADVVATLSSRRVGASEVKQFSVPDGDVPVLEELREMLDELGYESIVKMGEKRRKELENSGPGIRVQMNI